MESQVGRVFLSPHGCLVTTTHPGCHNKMPKVPHQRQYNWLFPRKQKYCSQVSLMLSSSRDRREENPSRVPRQHPRKGHVEDDGGEDFSRCSGKYCRSCTGGVIADCVAVCCCPCAVLSFFSLAFFKAPWMMGRRCLGLGKKKENKRKYERSGSGFTEDMDGISRKGREGFGIPELLISGFEEEDELGNFNARSEAESVWLELYQVGHLGFGRVSYTGISPQAKGN